MKHVLLTVGIITSALYTCAQTGTVADFRKISETKGNLSTSLTSQGMFGFVYESRTQNTILSGAPFDGNGAFYRVVLKPDGDADSAEKISAADFAFFDGLTNARFGTAVIELEDRNGDSMPDYLVGAPGLDPGGGICLLLSDENSFTLIKPDFPAELAGHSETGSYIATEGDAVYITSTAGGGAIFQCNLTSENTLDFVRKIDVSHPLLSEKLDDGDRFGSGLTLTDLNNDGIADILCGAPGDDDQDTNFGAVYQLYRTAAGDLDSIQKISRLEGNFGGFMNTDDEFGISVRAIGDLDENEAVDYAVGAPGDDDGGTDIGAVWILFMRPNGTVLNEKKINRLAGNFGGDINYDDRFGTRIATLGDFNGDGTIDFVSGAVRDDDGGVDKGSFYTIFIERCPPPVALFAYEDNGGTVQFTSEGGPGYSHIWNFSDGGYSQQQNPVHTYETSGNYWVCLAINNDCGGNNFCQYVSVSVSTSTGIAETGNEAPRLYPNPAARYIEVDAGIPVDRLEIRDITGKISLQHEHIQPRTRIDISSLPAGLYLAEIWVGGKSTVRKIQKTTR